MTTSYSNFIWDNFKLLWSLQFPWRFLVFTTVFVSIVCSYSIFFLSRLFKNNKKIKLIPVFLTIFFVALTIFKYYKYFRPQTYLNVTDKNLTTFEEIAWTQSKTVVHFIPKEAKAKKNEYGVYVLDIEKKDLPKQIYEVKSGVAKVKILENKYAKKRFFIDAESSTTFQLNTFNFPGWSVYLDNKKGTINDNNKLKLITVNIPKGEYRLRFIFQDTLIRKIANLVSLSALFVLFAQFIVHAFGDQTSQTKIAKRKDN